MHEPNTDHEPDMEGKTNNYMELACGRRGTHRRQASDRFDAACSAALAEARKRGPQTEVSR